ncbi:MAG: serine hydrolase [Alphaproteobacteria bacterium]
MSSSVKISRRGLFFGLAASALTASDAEARARRWVLERLILPEPAWIAVDPISGKEFDGQNADELRRPASIAKLMTIYLAFDAIRSGDLPLDEALPISEIAARQGNFKLPYGDTPVTAELLIKAAGAFSCNSAATELAMRILKREPVLRREEAFAALMTYTAQQKLGMPKTVLKKASGWPVPGQVTTAREISKLAPAVYEHFQDDVYRQLLCFQSFELNGKSYFRHDYLMYQGNTGERNEAIKVAKTGQQSFQGAVAVLKRGERRKKVPAHETERNMAIYAENGTQRVSVVVLGAPNQGFRLSKTNRLIETGFREGRCHEFEMMGFDVTPRDYNCPARSTPALIM